MVEGHAAVAGHQQVRPAVTVIVGNGAPVRVKERPIHSCLARDVPELPVAQVPVQAAAQPLNLLLLRPAEAAAAGQEHVQQAIAIVVEQGHTAAERFQDGVLVGLEAVVVRESNARLGGHVSIQIGKRCAAANGRLLRPLRQWSRVIILASRRRAIRTRRPIVTPAPLPAEEQCHHKQPQAGSFHYPAPRPPAIGSFRPFRSFWVGR